MIGQEAVLSNRDVYARITNQIVEAVEAGAPDWRMPWHTEGGARGRPINAATLRLYRGINVIALWAAAATNGFSARYWATYRQWLAAGGQVRQGEKATFVVFYKEIERERTVPDRNEAERERFFVARAYSVFNADQVDGWAAPSLPPPAPAGSSVLEGVEAFVSRTGADVHHGGDRAYYAKASGLLLWQPAPPLCRREAISRCGVRQENRRIARLASVV